MGYPLERKAAVLKRMLPPHNMAIRQLSQEEGISEGTLYNWRTQARGEGKLLDLPEADAGPEGWSSRDKFAAVLETAALNEAALTETALEDFFERSAPRALPPFTSSQTQRSVERRERPNPDFGDRDYRRSSASPDLPFVHRAAFPSRQ